MVLVVEILALLRVKMKQLPELLLLWWPSEAG